MLDWQDKEYDVSKIVKGMVPPIGATTPYRPGEGGVAERDLTAPALTPSASTAPRRTVFPQERLSQLETAYPGGAGALPVMDNRPSATSVVPTGGDRTPRYQVPSDMMTYFDEAVKTLTDRSTDTDRLRDISQGFRLIGLSPKDAAQARIAATKALGDIEGIRRNAAANIAQTMSALMMEPSRFERDIYGKQMEYDLGRRGQDIQSRRAAVEEAKAPWEIKKMATAAPETIQGYGLRGERKTMGWNPKSQKWETLTSGALPVEARAGEVVFDPVTGEVIGQGAEGSRFKENLGQIAFKSYADEMKKVEDDLRFMVSESTEPKKKESILKAKSEAQVGAWDRLVNTMKRLGYGEMFEGTEATSIQKRKENETIEDYLKRTGS